MRLIDLMLLVSNPTHSITTPCACSGYSRVAEEEEAEDRVRSEEVNEGAAQAPARQRQHSEPGHHQEDGMREG